MFFFNTETTVNLCKNGTDLGLTLHFTASSLGLHCLLTSFSWDVTGISGLTIPRTIEKKWDLCLTLQNPLSDCISGEN